MTKRYFISHSSTDKPLALEIESLMPGEAWVDLYEIGLGELLLSEITKGIEAATDFVLLWSKASATSRWVEFEFHMAFALWIRDNGIGLRIVCIDDTPTPLHFQPFLQGRNVSTGREIMELLVGSSERTVAKRTFFNRNTEIGQVEEALYQSTTSSMWICGLGGVGKRALALESVRRLTSGTDAFRSITVSAGIAEPELHLLVAKAARMEPLGEHSTIDEFSSSTAEMISSFASAGGVWIFEEADHWLEDDGSFGRIAVQVMHALLRGANDWTGRLAIFTSRRRPRVDGSWNDHMLVASIRGLAPNHAIPLLRDRGGSGTEAELKEIAVQLDGHPLALEIIAPQLPVSAVTVASQRTEIATDLIDPRKYSADTWRVLELLAVIDGPLSAEDLAENLGWSAKTLQSSIAEASSFGMTEYSELGYIFLHPLLRDYFLRSYRKDPANQSKTIELARLSAARFATRSTEDPDFVLSLLTTFKLLGMAGRFEEARSLRSGLIGTLFSTANELYQEKRWAEALQYLDESLTGNTEIDRDALLLKAKCLAYTGKIAEARVLGDELVAENENSPKVLRDRGRIEFIARNWDSAIRFYEMAIPLRRNNSQLWSDIAQCRIRKEEWAAAGAAAKMAIDLGGDTPYTLNLYSQALENQGLLEDAKHMMDLASQREPRNPGYRHRSGRIALQLGNREVALASFRAAVEIDPTYFESWLSIASFMTDSRDFPAAEDALRNVEGRHGAPAHVVQNLQAKVALLKGILDEAQRLIELALSASRDYRNLALAIRILVARGDAKLMPVGQTQASVKLLAKELDRSGHLAEMKDLWESSPQYF